MWSGTVGAALVADPERDAAEAEILERFRQLPDPAARADLVERYLPLAEHLAARFVGRGESRDDLVQVASLGLVHAIDRFDPDRGVQFQTFASVTIVGEIRRHFRDRGWSIRVPRGLQEAALEINRALARLWQRLGRSPTIAEIAAEVDLPEETVLEAMDAVQAYSTSSLDVPVGEDGATSAGDMLGEDDPSFDTSEEWVAISPALADLPERERRILYLRFFKDMTQSEIAEIDRDLADARVAPHQPVARPGAGERARDAAEPPDLVRGLCLRGVRGAAGRYLKIDTPPGPINRPTMIITMPAATDPRTIHTMPAITRTAATIHNRVAAVPLSAKSSNMLFSFVRR